MTGQVEPCPGPLTHLPVYMAEKCFEDGSWGPFKLVARWAWASAFYQAPLTGGAEFRASGVQEEPVLRAFRVMPLDMASRSLGTHLG